MEAAATSTSGNGTAGGGGGPSLFQENPSLLIGLSEIGVGIIFFPNLFHILAYLLGRIEGVSSTSAVMDMANKAVSGVFALITCYVGYTGMYVRTCILII